MDKKELTKLFLEESGNDASAESIKKHMLIWWVAPFSPIGLRLTHDGADFLNRSVKLQKYKFELKEDRPRNLKIMLQMNKYFASPFYINNNTITVYGETEAVMMGLYGGDIATYLNNFER